MSQEKKKLIDELLKDAPPGQVKQVLSDVKTLVGDDALVHEVAEKTIQAYDLDHLTQATYTDDGTERQFLVSRHGELGSGVSGGICSYLDPSTKKCVGFDHLGQKCDGSSAREATEEELKGLAPKGDKQTEELRHKIQEEMSNNYMKDNYPHGTCAVYDITSSGGTEIVICISSTVYKPRSYWSGRWTSEWTLAGKGSNFSLEGKSDVTTHYYENGNVQFRSNRTFEKKDLGIKAGGQPDLSAVVKAAKKHISEEEFDYQSELQEALREFAETTFKKLRRQLPLTQVTFPWTTGAASLATELVSRGKGK